MKIDPNKFLPTKIIENLLGPSSKALGYTLGALFYWIFQKPIEYGIIKENEFNDLVEKTSNNLENIPQENKDSSKSGLIMKAMEEAQYQLSENNLRQMFANLIASSADNRKNDFITPRFATVLSQLGSDDARFFKCIVQDNNYDLIYGYLIEYTEKYGPYHTYTNKIYWSKNEYKELPQKSVDILVSLGLVTVSEDIYPSSEFYNNIYNNIEFLLKNNISIKNNDLIEFKKGNVSVTAFGQLFAKAVLN